MRFIARHAQISSYRLTNLAGPLALAASLLTLFFGTSVGAESVDDQKKDRAEERQIERRIQRQTEVEGLWATGGSLVRVSRNGESLQMIVVALEEPLDEQGLPLSDIHNPDKSLRSQSILGMDLLAHYKFTGKRWEGKIYDPESGSTYSSRMQKKDDVLELRGYIGTPLLGKTKKFKPISRCRDDMLVMLKSANITGHCGI